MQKYYFIKWPDSKKYVGHPDCIQAVGGMSLFVPCELYDKNEENNGTDKKS